MGRYTGILGLLTMLGLAFIFSTNRRAIRVKTVVWGLGLQIVFAVFVLKIEFGQWLFQKAGDGATHYLKLQFKFYLRGVVFVGRAESIALRSQSRSTARTRAARKSQPALRNC